MMMGVGEELGVVPLGALDGAGRFVFAISIVRFVIHNNTKFIIKLKITPPCQFMARGDLR
jgi:hypothetical protein